MVSLKLVSGLIATAAAVVSAAPLSQRSGNYFDHFMVVVLENQDYSVCPGEIWQDYLSRELIIILVCY